LIADTQPLGAVAEAVRSLRTSLQFLGVDTPVRRLVVTSPGPEAGKSMLAANLATAYAQAGYVTVLVSGDLRRPRVEDIFDVPKGRGFTDLIAELSGDIRPSTMGAGVDGNGHAGAGAGTGAVGGAVRSVAPGAHVSPDRRDAKIAEFLVPTTVSNLFLLPCGSRPPNPAELLASRRTDEVLAALGDSVDVVIIDAPPLLAVTDPAVLASKADGVVLVAALNETHRVAAQRARDALSIPAVRVLGLVLNKVDRSSGGYYDYYGEPRVNVAARPSARRRGQRSRRERTENEHVPARG
jgi:Mrp family chromosome partitioning ATPase